jgi:hypothetical protein
MADNSLTGMVKPDCIEIESDRDGKQRIGVRIRGGGLGSSGGAGPTAGRIRSILTAMSGSGHPIVYLDRIQRDGQFTIGTPND